jgi:hypothetical protein
LIAVKMKMIRRHSMEVSILSIITSRKTDEVVSQKVVGSEVMDEEEYYRPLVELFYGRMKQDGFLNKCEEELKISG